MSTGYEEYDVAIVGASLAGSTAATLYGRRGLRVALVERHSDPNAFKRVCTHLIQSSATPMLRRHGLDRLIEEAGGIRYRMRAWTRWGWIDFPQFFAPQEGDLPGYNLRREVLDPMLRRLASATPGVDLMLGTTVEELVTEGGRVAGIVVRDPSDARRTIRARLVVAADGRNSAVAEMAGVGAWTIPNRRVAYGAYYRNLPQTLGTDAAIWFLEPDIAYAFPTDDGQVILATMFPRDRLPALKTRLRDFPSLFEGVPDFPGFEGAEAVGGLIGMNHMPNQWRRRPPGGLAFLGDAAVCSDPLFGIGCGWAFQGAECLVDATAPAVGGSPSELDRAVGRYRRQLRKGIGGHYLITSDYSRARLFNPGEKMLFAGAARDTVTARRLGEVASRKMPARGFFSPVTGSRALLVNLRHRLRHPAPPAPRGLGTGSRLPLEVNGVATPYLQAGDPSASEAVVFVHGNPGAGDDWAHLVDQVGGLARAVAPDFPGFGTAAKPAGFDYTVAGYADHLQATLEALGIRRAHLVLHDFGGPWGLAWAVEHPEAIASVTLINTGALQDYRWHYLARIWRTPGLGEIFQASATRPAFRFLLRHGNPRGLPRGFVDKMYNDYDRGTKRAILKLYRATEPDSMQALVEPLRALDLPALVVWGARDPYIPVVQAHRQTAAFPGARIEILPDSGHWPFADDPEATARLVTGFLREQLGAPALRAEAGA